MLAAAPPAVAAPGAAVPDGTALVEALAAADRAALERAVAAVERAPATTAELALALFRAAQVCEGPLADPARALALYERLARELPSAGLAIAAERRAAALRGPVGRHAEHAARAAELARLAADGEREPAAGAAEAIGRRARALADAPWPGAAAAALWWADWLRRAGRASEARAGYAEIAARWPASAEAAEARRAAVASALESRDWAAARALAAALPITAAADRVTRDALVAAADRGARRARWLGRAHLALAGAAAALLASAAHAAARAPRPRRLRPPFELLYLAPVAAVLVGAAATTHEAAAPAVAILCGGGLAIATLSGAALDLARVAGGPPRARIALHIAAALVAGAALLAIALLRGDLLDQVIETVRAAPAR